jgi:hypothetical protein
VEEGNNRSVLLISFYIRPNPNDTPSSLKGAVFLAHHRRQESLKSPSAYKEDQGVRFSIPLTEIAELEHTVSAEFPSLAVMRITPHVPAELGGGETPPGSINGEAKGEGVSKDKYSVNIGTLWPEGVWGQFHQYIAKAKVERKGLEGRHLPLFFDMGPLGLHMQGSEISMGDGNYNNDVNNGTHVHPKEGLLRTALNLDAWETEFWGESTRFASGTN